MFVLDKMISLPPPFILMKIFLGEKASFQACGVGQVVSLFVSFQFTLDTFAKRVLLFTHSQWEEKYC